MWTSEALDVVSGQNKHAVKQRQGHYKQFSFSRKVRDTIQKCTALHTRNPDWQAIMKLKCTNVCADPLYRSAHINNTTVSFASAQSVAVIAIFGFFPFVRAIALALAFSLTSDHPLPFSFFSFALSRSVWQNHGQCDGGHSRR